MNKVISFLFIFFVTASYASFASALETTSITIRGNLDSRSNFSTPPPAPTSFSDLSDSAFFSSLVTVTDSGQNLRNLTVYFWHRSSSNVTVRIYADGAFINGGAAGVPYMVGNSQDLTLVFSDSGSQVSSGNAATIIFSIPWKVSNSLHSIITDARVTFESLTLLSSSSALATTLINANRSHLVDFDGDLNEDSTIFRPESGMWAMRLSSDYSVMWKQWGLPGDFPIAGDYTGDGKADIVVWRPSNGNWYICKSETNFNCFEGDGNLVYQFGLPGDRPLRADSDGDGILDLAVWRSTYGFFIYRSSKTGKVLVTQWGLPGDIPIATATNE